MKCRHPVLGEVLAIPEEVLAILEEVLAILEYVSAILEGVLAILDEVLAILEEVLAILEERRGACHSRRDQDLYCAAAPVFAYRTFSFFSPTSSCFHQTPPRPSPSCP